MAPDLGQRFSVERRLGEDGQGTVWLALDGRTGQHVAIKLLPHTGQPKLLRRELALPGRLRHPGLAAIHDFGVTTRGEAFLVSEYVDATPLSQLWTERHVEDLLPGVARLLGSLDFLHRRGVVHRDVKPANVLVTDETVKLVDFGLAAAVGAETELSGTPGYLAPEVLAGEAPTAAADLYAVGAMLHLFITRRMPFEGETSAVIRAQLSREVEAPDGPLGGLVGQLLARDPAQRPSSAAETLVQLEETQGTPAGRAASYLAGKGLPAPSLVGRHQQIDQVEACLDAIQDTGRSRGLVVVGRQGEGATRLCGEVAVLAVLRGWEVRWGLGTARDRGNHRGEGLDTAGERALGVARLCDGTAVAARERPLVVLLDGTVDELEVLAAALLARRRDLRLLLCVTARPGDRETLTRLAAFSLVELGSLDEREIAELVSSMLPTGWASTDLAAAVHRQSGGNPQLATELTRVAAAARVEDESLGVEGDLGAAVDGSSGPLARPVPAAHWRDVWTWAEDYAGCVIDPACKSPASTYALPAVADEAWPRVAFTHAGPLLDPLLEDLMPDGPPPPAVKVSPGAFMIDGDPEAVYIVHADPPAADADEDDDDMWDLWSSGDGDASAAREAGEGLEDRLGALEQRVNELAARLDGLQVTDDLERLDALRQRVAITDAEYEAVKRRLLS